MTVAPASTVRSADSVEEGHLPGSREYRRLLVALFFAGVATFAQLYAPQAVLPQIAADLHRTPAATALLVSLATVGLAVGVLPWSFAADRYGRVRTIVAAAGSAAVVGLLVPFAPSFGLLLVGRLVQGFLVGGVPAIAIAYLTEEVHPAHTARAAGVYVAGTTIGGLSGRLISGPLGEVWSWRAGLVVVAVVCGVSAVLFRACAPAARRFRPLPRPVPPERRMRRMVARHVRDRRQVALYAQGFLLMGGFVATYNYLGFRLQARPFGLSPTVTSLLFVAYLAGTWSSARAGALAARFGRRPVLACSAAVMAAGALVTLCGSLPLVIVGLLVATAGFFGAHSTAAGWVGHAATVGRAQASSLYNLAYYTGSSLFGWCGGVLYGLGGWAGTAGMVATLAAVAAAVSVTALRGVAGPATSQDHTRTPSM